jgi:hypothetical protein
MRVTHSFMDYGIYSLQRTYTEANIDENVFSAVDGCVSALYDDLLRDDSGDIGIDDIELVVQLKVRQTEVYCQYYFVDHKARILFWLHDPSKATEILFGMLPGVYDLSHMGAPCGTYDAVDMNLPIGYALEEEYWFVTCSCVRFSYFWENQI